jgi:hypothetical protein
LVSTLEIAVMLFGAVAYHIVHEEKVIARIILRSCELLVKDKKSLSLKYGKH